MNRRSLFALSVLIVVLAACTPEVTVQPAEAAEPVRQLTVVGEGQVSLPPDIAYVNIGVRTEADTVGEALEQNNAQAHEIIDTLLDEGIAEEDIQTANFSVNSQSEFGPEGEQTRTFFTATNSVFVTVRDLENLGGVLDAAVSAGANNINGISFDLQDKSSARSEARALAVESAGNQAEELVDLAGLSLGEIMSISSSFSSPIQSFGAEEAAIAAEPRAAVPISRGEIEINAVITIVYSIE